jgi:hypothetical protein
MRAHSELWVLHRNILRFWDLLVGAPDWDPLIKSQGDTIVVRDANFQMLA